MNIFITGGSGFIGQQLTAALIKDGHTVFVLTREKKALTESTDPDLIIIRGCLEDPASYRSVLEKNIDIVYHLAAIPGQKWSFSKSDYVRTNIQGTKKLLHACRGKIRRFVFCSSINASTDNRFRKDPYGWSKFQAEKLVRKEGSFETLILRPAIVYGPGDIGGMFLKLCRMIKQKKFFIVGSGKKILPLIYIDDLIQAFLKTSHVDHAIEEPLEIVSSEKNDLKTVVTIIAKKLDVSVPQIRIPVFLARSAAFCFECLSPLVGKIPPVTNHQIDILTRPKFFDPQKARVGLGFSASTDLQTGLRLTIDWYQKNELL